MKNDKNTKNELIEELESARKKVNKQKSLLKKPKHTEHNPTVLKRADERVKHLNAVLKAIRNVN